MWPSGEPPRAWPRPATQALQQPHARPAAPINVTQGCPQPAGPARPCTTQRECDLHPRVTSSGGASHPKVTPTQVPPPPPECSHAQPRARVTQVTSPSEPHSGVPWAHPRYVRHHSRETQSKLPPS